MAKKKLSYTGGLAAAVAKSAMARATDQARRIADTKHEFPIELSKALVQADFHKQRLSITATDLVTFMTTSIPAKVRGAGRALLPARALHEMTAAMPAGDIELESPSTEGNDTVTMSSDKGSRKSTVRIQSGSPRDFPKRPDPGETPFVEVSAQALREIIGITMHAAVNSSKDETRPQLGGVHLESEQDELIAVTTDGHRLVLARATLVPELLPGITIPSAGAAMLVRVCEQHDVISIAYQKPYLFARTADTDLAIKEIEMPFPPFRQVIPSNYFSSFEVDRQALVTAMRRSMVMEAPQRGLRFELRRNGLVVAARSPDIGEMREELEIEGGHEQAGDAPITFGLNPAYVLEIMTRFPAERFRFEVGNASDRDPVVVRAAGSERYLGVVMPMMLDL